MNKNNEDDFPDDPFDKFPVDKFDTFPGSNSDSFPDAFSGDQDESSRIDAIKETVPSVPKKKRTTDEILKEMKSREDDMIKRVGILNYSVALGVTNAVSGGMVGGVIGVFNGAMEGRNLGLTMQTGYPLHIIRSGVANAASFGGFLGTYSGVKCLMVHTRQKKDLLNAFTAGTLAGMVGSLRTRSPQTILLSGLGSGALMAAIDSFSPDHK